jgi:hypothetical protein
MAALSRRIEVSSLNFGSGCAVTRRRFSAGAADSCFGLVRALCLDTHEAWLEAHIYLNIQLLD